VRLPLRKRTRRQQVDLDHPPTLPDPLAPNHPDPEAGTVDRTV
jgi:hypothetical protein